MNRLILILFTVILLLTAHCAFSQGIWKTYTTADGLAANFVFCIAQDKIGNMWFGTWGDGLSKLDTNGVWTNYFTGSYLSAVIYDIEIDSSNNKWFAIDQLHGEHWGNYVVKFDDSTFTYYMPLGNQQVDNGPDVLGLDSLGQIWCGTPQINAYWFDGNAWHSFYVPGTWDAWDGISDIEMDRYGKLYFGHSNGVSTKDRFLLGIGAVADIAFDKQNRLWAGVTDVKSGLWMYDGNSLYRWTKDDGLISPLSQVTDVAIDSNNNVWIANAPYWYDSYGVSKFDGSNYTHFNVGDGLGHGFVYDIYVDKNGDIWFGTRAGGVSVLHDTTITKIKGLSEPSAIIKTFVLYQNYPNPFNLHTCINYNLNASAQVELSIYNLLGKEVRTLVNKYQSAGKYETNWNGTNNSGKEVSSGIYLVVLECNDFKKLIKLTLIR